MLSSRIMDDGNERLCSTLSSSPSPSGSAPVLHTPPPSHTSSHVNSFCPIFLPLPHHHRSHSHPPTRPSNPQSPTRHDIFRISHTLPNPQSFTFLYFTFLSFPFLYFTLRHLRPASTTPAHQRTPSPKPLPFSPPPSLHPSTSGKPPSPTASWRFNFVGDEGAGEVGLDWTRRDGTGRDWTGPGIYSRYARVLRYAYAFVCVWIGEFTVNKLLHERGGVLE